MRNIFSDNNKIFRTLLIHKIEHQNKSYLNNNSLNIYQIYICKIKRMISNNQKLNHNQTSNQSKTKSIKSISLMIKQCPKMLINSNSSSNLLKNKSRTMMISQLSTLKLNNNKCNNNLPLKFKKTKATRLLAMIMNYF